MATLRLALALAVLSGCSSVVDGNYRGDPLITIFMHATENPVPTNPNTPARVGMFFYPEGAANPYSFDMLVEQPSESLAIDIPNDFSWSLFDAPPSTVMALTPGGASYAFGWPMIYEDANGNGRYDEGEQIVGVAPNEAILFASQTIGAEDSPTGIVLPAGYHVVELPFVCAPLTPQVPAHDGDCGVPLGAACSADSDCGTGGMCLTIQPTPWPAGYCAIPEPPTAGCRPADGALYGNSMNAPNGWWVLACQTTADCHRANPYQCDVALGGCLPSGDITLPIQTPQLPLVCVGPPQGGPPGMDGGPPQGGPPGMDGGPPQGGPPGMDGGPPQGGPP